MDSDSNFTELFLQKQELFRGGSGWAQLARLLLMFSQSLGEILNLWRRKRVQVHCLLVAASSLPARPDSPHVEKINLSAWSQTDCYSLQHPKSCVLRHAQPQACRWLCQAHRVSLQAICKAAGYGEGAQTNLVWPGCDWCPCEEVFILLWKEGREENKLIVDGQSAWLCFLEVWV